MKVHPFFKEVIAFLFLIFFCNCIDAQTSWTGLASTDWSASGNWTNGVPNITDDVIIGDANFTGSNQPSLTSNSACKSIVVGGSVASTLTINRNNFSVSGNFTNNSNGTISLRRANLSVNGNWINNGTFAGSGPGNSNSSNVIFGGSAQNVSGNSTFENVIVNSGSIITLQSDISVLGTLIVNGTINPGESPVNKLTTSSTFTLSSSGTLKVTGALFTDNYSAIPTISTGSTIDYSSTTNAQTVSTGFIYSNLKISGTTVKSLTANLPGLSSTSSSDGNISVTSGTFDLGSFTADRSSSGGGRIIVSNGATLKIGGTNSLPANYSTYTFGLTSTTEYNGGAQTVTAQTYGNLKMSSSGGAATKTGSSTGFTVSGNFIETVGAGTSVLFNAGSALTISGIDSIYSSGTFDGGSYTHTIAGNIVNSGTITGNSSTINMTGAGTSISGAGVFNFNDLGIYASKITASSGSNLTVAGNFLTSSPGMFTHNSGGTFTMTGTGKSITGTDIIFSNLVISGTITTSSSIAIAGNLSVNSAKSFTASNDVITLSGTSKTITGPGTISLSQLSISGSITTASDFSISSALDVSGTGSSFIASAGTVTFTGTSTFNGTANLYNITLSGTSLKLATNSVLGVANILGSGSMDVTTSQPNTVVFNGAGDQNIPSTSFFNLILSNGGTKTAAGNITINGVFTINSNVTFNASTYTHSLYNNFVNNGIFTASTSNFQFRGTRDVTVTGTTTFNTLTINKNSSGNIVVLNSNVSAGNIAMTNGEIKTGSNTITITIDRSGPGIIIGTIKRQHAFVTGVDYAFESPYNKINFNSVSGVTSITETVSLGLIADYPYISAIYREYDFSVPSGTYDANVYLHYENSELAGNNKATMQFWGNSGPGWTQLSKTGYDATNNYVYTNNITNLQPRYTLCSVNSVYRWTGKVNTNWNNTGNWSYVQGGNPQGLPGVSDVVLIGDTVFSNQPVISQIDSAKTILFYSTTASTITIASGGSLVSGGNILGFYTGNVNHNINIGNQNLSIGGNLVLSDGTSNHTINISAGSGNIIVGQSITQSGGANIILGSGDLSVFGDYLYTSGTFTAGSGSFTFNGTQTQQIAPVTYNNLIINKASGTADFNTGVPTVNGNFTLTAGESTFDVNTTVKGNVSTASGTILNGGTATLSVGGNWISNGSFSAGSSTINFNGTSTQSIGSTIFNNLIVNKSAGTASLGSNISVEGDLTITSGILDILSFTANRTSLGGVFKIGASGTLNLAASNIPSTYSSYTLDTLSTVNYNGSSTQIIGSIAYGNLTLMNGGANAKTISGLTTVNGNLNINSGATLNGSAYSILLGGNWVNNGTYSYGTSTVILNGTSKTITGTSIFNKVTVYGSYSVGGSDITYNGLLNVTTGASYAGGGGNAVLNGDLINSGTLTSTGKTTFSGTQLQTIRLLNALQSSSTGEVDFNGSVSPVLNSTSTPQFANLVINNTGGVSPSVGWSVFASFTIGAGATFNGGISTHNIYGAFTNNGTVTSSGVMNFAPTKTQTAALVGTSFSSTGTVIFGGRGLLTVTGVPTTLTNVTIENSNVSGISSTADWTVAGNFTIRDTAIFSATTHNYVVKGNFTSNGSLVGGSSTFNINSDTSSISGSSTTNFYNLTVTCPTPVTGKIFAKSDFNVTSNFVNNGKLDVSAGTIRFTGSTNSIISGNSTDTLSQIDIAKTGSTTSVTLAIDVQGIDNLDIISGTLDASTFGLNQDPTSGGVGAMFLRSGATLKLGGTNALPTFASNSIDSLSTVWYYGTTQSITSMVKPIPYGNLTISSSGTTTASGKLNIRSNFTLTNSTFVPGNFADTLGGNWSMASGSFTSSGSTFVVNGGSAQTISSTGAFNNLTINKSAGTTSGLTDVTINGALNFVKGNIITGSNKILISSTGSVTNASQTNGWVYGKLNKTFSGALLSRVIEIGDSTNYTPLTVTFNAISVAGSLTGSTTAKEHPSISTSSINQNKSVNRYFTLTNSGLTFSSATVTMNWIASDVDASANTANFVSSVYNGSTWAQATSGSKTGTSLQASGIVSQVIGDIAIGESVVAITWTGATSNDWNVSTNWTGGAIPGLTNNVTIPGSLSTYPLVNLAAGQVNNITIATGASLTVTNQTLKISGAIFNSGTFIASGGTIELNSNSAQTISSGNFTGKQLNNLVLSNTSVSGVTLADTLAILNSLLFGNVNNSKLNSAGFLLIKSTASNTGRIADATNGGTNSGNTISGNVIVERYIPANNVRGYRFVTPSVNTSNSIHANWQEGAVSRANNPHPGYGTHITGTRTDQTNGFDGTITGQQSLYRYDLASNNFVAFSNTNSLTLSDTTSYLLYFRGDRTINLDLNVQGSTNTTLRAAGTISQGNIIYNNTVDTTNANGGFTLIANPYASPISWASIYSNNTGITNSYTYFDPKINGGSYVTVTNNGTRSDLSSNATVDIQSGESFFIQANSRTAPTLTVRETFKSSNNNINIFKATSAPSDFYISLFINDNLGRRNADGVLTRFDGSFSNKIDGNDADEMENFNENIALNSNSHHLSIESRATPSITDTVRIYMSNMNEKNYDLQFNTINFNSQPGMTAMLVDNFTGVKTNLSFDTATIVPFSVTSNIASSDTGRFYIVFASTITLPVTLTNFKGISKSSGVELSWVVSQENNLLKYDIERSSSGNSFSKLGSVNSNGNSSSYQPYTYFDNAPLSGQNYYRLKMIDKNGSFTYSYIIVVNTNVLTSSISVYPNPFTGSTLQLKMINIASGKYPLHISDKNGRIIYTDVLTHDINSEKEAIHLDRLLSKGVYQLSLGDKSMELVVQ